MKIYAKKIFFIFVLILRNQKILCQNFVAFFCYFMVEFDEN